MKKKKGAKRKGKEISELKKKRTDKLPTGEKKKSQVVTSEKEQKEQR